MPCEKRTAYNTHHLESKVCAATRCTPACSSKSPALVSSILHITLSTGTQFREQNLRRRQNFPRRTRKLINGRAYRSRCACSQRSLRSLLCIATRSQERERERGYTHAIHYYIFHAYDACTCRKRRMMLEKSRAMSCVNLFVYWLRRRALRRNRATPTGDSRVIGRR